MTVRSAGSVGRTTRKVGSCDLTSARDDKKNFRNSGCRGGYYSDLLRVRTRRGKAAKAG